MLSRSISYLSRLGYRNVSRRTTSQVIRLKPVPSAIMFVEQPTTTVVNPTFRRHLTSELGLPAARRLCTNTTNEVNKVKGSGVAESKKSSILDDFHLRAKRPSKMDRRILVLMGRYKSDEEIPDFVSDTVINATKNKFRIAVNMAMGACTLVGALVMIYIGRKRMHAGESIVGMNMERRKHYYKENPYAKK